MHGTDRVWHRRHDGLSPSHLVLDALQLIQDRKVLFFLAVVGSSAALDGLLQAEGELGEPSKQSKPKRAHAMHGRPPWHLTWSSAPSGVSLTEILGGDMCSTYLTNSADLTPHRGTVLAVQYSTEVDDRLVGGGGWHESGCLASTRSVDARASCGTTEHFGWSAILARLVG